LFFFFLQFSFSLRLLFLLFFLFFSSLLLFFYFLGWLCLFLLPLCRRGGFLSHRTLRRGSCFLFVTLRHEEVPPETLFVTLPCFELFHHCYPFWIFICCTDWITCRCMT